MTYVCELDKSKQEELLKAVANYLGVNGISGQELEQALEELSASKLSDLEGKQKEILKDVMCDKEHTDSITLQEIAEKNVSN